MRIVTTPQIPATHLTWRSRRGELMHTVICKATYVLEPGESRLSQDHEPICEADQHWEDSEQRSLRIASDLAPFKRRADVVVVGAVFAAPGAPTRRVIGRLAVGDVDKSFVAHCDRTVSRDGVLTEGRAFSRMPLVWERARGGDETENPVGRTSSRNDVGHMLLPNLQPVAFEPEGPDFYVPSIGLGPIAAVWPYRMRRLGAHAALPPEALLERAEDFDASYFNVAPPDQQLDDLPSNAHLVLEALHPDHPRLATRLPGHNARAIADRAGIDINLVCDTLWIDTERSLCTLTWRGSFRADALSPDERIIVALEGAEMRRHADVIRKAVPPGEQTLTLKPRPTIALPERSALPFGAANQPGPSAPSLAGTPFQSATTGQRSTEAPPSQPHGGPPSPRASSPSLSAIVPPPAMSAPPGVSPPLPMAAPASMASQRPAQVVSFPPPPPSVMSPALGNPRDSSGHVAAFAPTSLAQASLSQGPPPRPALASSVGSDSTMSSLSQSSISGGSMSSSSFAQSSLSQSGISPSPFAQSSLSQTALSQGNVSSGSFSASPPAHVSPSLTGGTPANMVAPAFMSAPRAPAAVQGPVAHDARAASRGVASASDAAARSNSEPAPKRISDKPAANPDSAKRPRTFVDLLWFESSAADRIRTQGSWIESMKGTGKGSPWLTFTASSEAQKKEVEPQSYVARALTRVAPLDSAGVQQAVMNAVDDDGFLVRPLVVVEGELCFAYSQLEALRLTITLAEPLAATDKKLKDQIDAATEVAKQERRSTPQTLETMLGRVRSAFQAVNKVYPANYLEATTERALIEERTFAKRVVLGGSKIIATLMPQNGGGALSVYLPDAIADRLPLLPRFRARLIAEPHARQDASDGEGVVLCALALGRVVSPSNVVA